jgi:hypothetical protein
MRERDTRCDDKDVPSDDSRATTNTWSKVRFFWRLSCWSAVTVHESRASQMEKSGTAVNYLRRSPHFRIFGTSLYLFADLDLSKIRHSYYFFSFRNGLCNHKSNEITSRLQECYLMRLNNTSDRKTEQTIQCSTAQTYQVWHLYDDVWDWIELWELIQRSRNRFGMAGQTDRQPDRRISGEIITSKPWD